jgi:hypothetical protein
MPSRVFLFLMQRAACLIGALVVLSLGLTSMVLGAGEIVLTISPPESQVGQPVEVLLRTFVPYSATTLGLASPHPDYPGAPGILDVLYPWDDYPFVVRAEIAGETVPIVLTRDVQDSTLWRGFWTPTKVGTWTIRSYNFGEGHPGTSTSVRVTEAASLGATDGGLTAGVASLGVAGGSASRIPYRPIAEGVGRWVFTPEHAGHLDLKLVRSACLGL